MPAERTANRSGPLASYRVLELADEKGAMCGKIFADAGADVVKIEPPGGCPTRRIPPYVDGMPGIERGLFFQCYQAGKRSLTIDIGQEDGRRLVRRLAESADFIVESQPANYLESVGLGYEALAERNPGLIYTSITPFGDHGPSAEWRAPDIVGWAAGGMMYLTGSPGRPPLQMSIPQACLHAGAEGAVASLLAHCARQRSGRGQRVVVDMQACVTWTLMNESGYPLFHGDVLHRSGVMTGSQSTARKSVYKCADGHVAMFLSDGVYARTGQEIIAWMGEEGVGPDWLEAVDFSTWSSSRFAAAESDQLMKEVRDVEAAIESFFQGLSRQEIYRRALSRNLLVAPVATVEDIAKDDQLSSRQYFQTVEVPALGRDLSLVGPFAQLGASGLRPASRAPTLGEHNQEVMVHELGLNAEELESLYSAGVI